MKEIFKPNSVNYILRTYLPTWNYEERIEEMVRFCNETGTKHVMLFTDAQHMVWNQLTLDEARHEAACMAKAKERLKLENIHFAINSSYNMPQSRWDHRQHNDYDYWATHADGTCEYRSPCLLDPKLEIYLRGYFKILAELGPDYIHIDDDHRYILMEETWGCFCDLHIQRFSEVSGSNWTRESLNEALKKDNNVRIKWIEFLGKRLVEIGEIISDTVHKVDPEIEVGMMVPCVHPLPVIGHSITNVLEAFHPVNKPVIRPCIGPYSDSNRRQVIAGLFYMEFIGHVLGDNVVYTPEIETTPFTRLSKSMTSVKFYIVQGILNRMNNPAISLCGYVGDSPFFELAYVDLLKNNRQYFEKIRELAPEHGTRQGLQFIWDFSSAKNNPHEISSHKELLWPAFVAHDIFGNLGFCHTYDESPIRFLAGDTAYALSKDRIIELLKSGLILDAGAARALAERGFSDLIGCNPAEHPITYFGAEECLDQEFFDQYHDTYIPLKGVPVTSVIDLQPASGCRKLSLITDHDRKEIAPGVILFDNKLGGKVAVLPYRISAYDPDLRHMNCYQRQTMFRNIFDWMAPKVIPAFVEEPSDFAIQCWDNGEQLTMCIINLSYDVSKEIVLSVNDRELAADQVSYVTGQGVLTSLGDQIEDISTSSKNMWRIKQTCSIFNPLILLVDK